MNCGTCLGRRRYCVWTSVNLVSNKNENWPDEIHLWFLSSPLKPGLYERCHYFYFCKTNKLKGWCIFESSILLLKCPSFPGEHMIISVLIVAMFPNSETGGADGRRGPQLWQDMRKAGDQALPLQVSVLRAPRGITPKHMSLTTAKSQMFSL